MNKGDKNTWTFDTQSNYHCPKCYQDGGRVWRFGIVYKYSHPESHTWTHVFPCETSRAEFYRIFKPFIGEYEYFERVDGD